MLGPYIYVLNVDGAAAVENLRVELARAKEQARRSDAAAVKAAEELKAEQAAHCQSKKVIAEMAIKLKDATDRCKFLEQEDRAAQKDLEKITAEAKDTRSAMRAMKEEMRQAGDITSGKPYMLRMKFRDPKYAPLDRQWSSENAYLDLAASARPRPTASAAEVTMDWKSFFCRSSTIQNAHCQYPTVWPPGRS